MLTKSYYRWLGIGAAAPLLLMAGVATAEPDLSTRIMNAAFDRSGFYDGQAEASPVYGSLSLGSQPYAYSGTGTFQPTQQLAYYYYRPYGYYYRPYRYYYRPYYRPVYYRPYRYYYRPYRYYYRPYRYYYRYGVNDYVFPSSVSYQLAYGTMR